MKRWPQRLGLVLFSTGWLVPFTYSVAAAYDFVWRWVWPMAAFDDSSNVSPFHPFAFSKMLLYVSVVWLAVVIAFWVLKATSPKG